jgi:mannose-6-phosphate isomerase-like protein (cupin superfamily)
MASIVELTDVHSAFDTAHVRELIHPDRDRWSPRQLRDLTSAMVSGLAVPLTSVARYRPDQRWWTRLALTSGVELWLLSWLPGQGTEPHDHGGAAGSFTVLTGTLVEHYRYPGGPVQSATRTERDAVAFGAGRAHQVRNRSTEPALSVHAYSPPLVPTREYASLNDIPAEIPPLPRQPVSW